MAEYASIPLQTVAVGDNVRFTDALVPCKSGYVIHRDGSGIFLLRGITNQCRARYRVSYTANISVPAGATPQAIATGIAINGEVVYVDEAVPTVAAAPFNVSRTTNIDVPRGADVSVSIENASTIPIAVDDANIVIERIA